MDLLIEEITEKQDEATEMFVEMLRHLETSRAMAHYEAKEGHRWDCEHEFKDIFPKQYSFRAFNKKWYLFIEKTSENSYTVYDVLSDSFVSMTINDPSDGDNIQELLKGEIDEQRQSS